MTTYSDRLTPLRRFLAENRALPLENIQILSEKEVQERWLVHGLEIIIRIHQDGSWTTYVLAADSPVIADQLVALGRYFQGRRPDLDLLVDMASASRTFLNKLEEMPGCSNQDCIDAHCVEKRKIKEMVGAFLARLSPTKESGANA